MSEKVLTSSGVSELWDAVKNRSLPIKSVTLDEYGSMSEEEKKSETLYIVSDDTPVTCYPISNPNLLDNWYFADPINQRGETEYINLNTDTMVYTIDRWKVRAGKVTVKKSECVTFEKNNNYNTFLQVIEQDVFDKTLTFSVLLADGTLYSGSGKVASDSPAWQTTRVYQDHVITLGLQNWTTGTGDKYVDVYIQLGNDTSSMDLLAMKLELGSVQTLAHKEGDAWVLNDPPPNKALELAKCQWYQRVYHDTTNNIAISVGYGGSEAKFAVFPLPFSMYKIPSQLNINTISLYHTTDWSEIEITRASVVGNSKNGMELFVYSPNIVKGDVYTILAKKDSYVIFDGNL